MSDPDVPVDLYIAYYGDAAAAQQDWDGLKDLASSKTVKIEAMVLASRDADGKIDVKDNFHTGMKGAGWGAAVGLVVGAIFPPSLLAGAAAGGLVGGGIGSLVSHADKNDIKADLDDSMPPNSSAIVAVFDEVWVDQVRKALKNAVKADEKQLDDESKDAVKEVSEAA
jgi:uncharacterized membrane protein